MTTAGTHRGSSGRNPRPDGYSSNEICAERSKEMAMETTTPIGTKRKPICHLPSGRAPSSRTKDSLKLAVKIDYAPAVLPEVEQTSNKGLGNAPPTNEWNPSIKTEVQYGITVQQVMSVIFKFAVVKSTHSLFRCIVQKQLVVPF